MLVGGGGGGGGGVGKGGGKAHTAWVLVVRNIHYIAVLCVLCLCLQSRLGQGI